MRTIFVLLGVLVGLTVAKPLPQLNLTLSSEDYKDKAPGINSAGPFAENCGHYCSLTYSEHTYPKPENFRACTTGCRTAQIEAFIAWPLQPEANSCESGCQDAYSLNKDQQFACCTGCQAPTMDSSLPDRNHIYFEGNKTSSNDDDINTFMSTLWSTLFQDVFSFREAINFDDLSDHAENMNTIMIPYRRADVAILTPDGVYTFSQYSFDNQDPAIGMWNNEDRGVVNPPSMSWIHNRSGCVWRRHRAVLNKMIFIVAMGLVILASLSCCLSLCADKTTKKVKIPPKVSTLKSVPFVKKAPYELGSKFILPQEKDGGYVDAKITLM